jgi:hypothetical protein
MTQPISVNQVIQSLFFELETHEDSWALWNEFDANEWTNGEKLQQNPWLSLSEILVRTKH